MPDQNHTVVTAGYGTYISTSPFGDNNYVTAGATPDGALVMAYVPQNQTITVNMTKLAGAVTAQWFDPSNNTYRPIAGSPFANSGSRPFTHPGANGSGDVDWVLVARDAARAAAAPARPLLRHLQSALRDQLRRRRPRFPGPRMDQPPTTRSL